jgi:hypothetical protein
MGSLLPISLLQTVPFLKPATRIALGPLLRFFPPVLAHREARRPTPAARAVRQWLTEPPDIQSRVRRRQLATLPGMLEPKRRRKTSSGTAMS